MDNEKKANFGIKSVRITNVGAIGDLQIDLKNRSLLALTAGNGIGKTTVLEAISLIGHLPCFPHFERNSKLIKPSLLSEKFPNQNLKPDIAPYLWYESIKELSSFPTSGLDGWLETNRPKRGSSYGVIEFRLFDKRNQTAIEYHFAILVHSPKLKNFATPRLTDILSRGDFDRSEGSDNSFIDDRFLDCCGLILFDAQTHPIEALVAQIALGRTFAIDKDGNGTLETITFSDADFPAASGKRRSVSYVNTDLNDFGRGNDLRESPKDLEHDFGAEMVARLRVEFDENGDFSHLPLLRDICTKVLKTPSSHFGLGNVVPSDFHLDGIEKKGRGASVKINRLDGSGPVDVNFLSAGENEVLFVSLVSINACKNGKWGETILLLDEPDLHIANSARLRFFRELLELTFGNCQLIMCTHSPAISDALSVSTVRKEECLQSIFKIAEDYDPGKIKLTCQYDAVFIERMHEINFASNPFMEIGRKVSHYFNRQVVLTKASLEASGVSYYNLSDLIAKFLVYGLGLVNSFLFGLGVISVANDKEYPDSPEAFGWHNFVDKTLYTALFGFAILLISIVLLRRRLTKKQKDLAGKILEKSN